MKWKLKANQQTCRFVLTLKAHLAEQLKKQTLSVPASQFVFAFSFDYMTRVNDAMALTMAKPQQLPSILIWFNVISLNYYWNKHRHHKLNVKPWHRHKITIHFYQMPSLYFCTQRKASIAIATRTQNYRTEAKNTKLHCIAFETCLSYNIDFSGQPNICMLCIRSASSNGEAKWFCHFQCVLCIYGVGWVHFLRASSVIYCIHSYLLFLCICAFSIVYIYLSRYVSLMVSIQMSFSLFHSLSPTHSGWFLVLALAHRSQQIKFAIFATATWTI